MPKRYAAIDSRTFVQVSLHTDSLTVAKVKAVQVWEHLTEAWEAKLAGDSSDAEKRFAAAQELAAIRGYRYLPVAKVAELPLTELLDRMNASKRPNGKPDRREAAALLGGAPEPQITVSRALELYWDLARDKTFGKTEDQLRRWKVPRKKATTTFIKVIDDKALAEITGDDMLDFRQWWLDRIENDGLTANSANKDLIHLGEIWKTVNRMKRLGLVLPLSDLAIKEGTAKENPPFSDTWIRDKLLAPGALDGLNKEARCIMLAMVNTGCRPSEIAGLLPHHIKLDAPVPYIRILPEGRQLKNETSEREIPLVGVSLTAFDECPNGFPRYFGKDGVTATINKYLKENDLKETPEHTLYGLRHAFEDRCLKAGIDERVRRDFMGHSLGRERYGDGGGLEFKRDLLQLIAL